MSSEQEFQGKTALVTGASSGIGAAIAVALAREGATVILTARDRTKLELVRQRCEQAGGNAWTHVAEVSDETQMQALADAVHARHPALDILVNNAGVVMGGFTWEVEPADWRRLHEINVMGVVHGIRAFVPNMIARSEQNGSGGHIVNMASVSGFVGARGMGTYSASKFAVVGLSESLRAELHRYHIGVSVVCPGYVNTPIQEKVKLVGALSTPEARKRVEKQFSATTLMPEQVAQHSLRAIRQNRAFVSIGREAFMARTLKRWAPGLLERYLRG
jgi:NAD(P)-dependent dehydrogenase (short-subunit alcohol dehydrogenase family)